MRRKSDFTDEVYHLNCYVKKIPLFYVENRPSTGDHPTITQLHYSPLPSLTKPSSSDTSQIWNPVDSFNSSFSSTSSNSDYDSISPLYGSESGSHSSTRTTTDDLSIIYDPNHQTIKEEEHGVKQELTLPVHGTPPQKKKIKNDGLSALPTPPSSTGFSSVTAKLMVRKARLC